MGTPLAVDSCQRSLIEDVWGHVLVHMKRLTDVPAGSGDARGGSAGSGPSEQVRVEVVVALILWVFAGIGQ